MLYMRRAATSLTTRNTIGNIANPHGTILPDLGAALSYAERTIRELQKEGEYRPPGPMMIVMDEARQVVLTLPFSPACA
jgi:hypothetical protein